MKSLVILSGGQDSTTCLYRARVRGDEIHTITFHYGQKHEREIECAEFFGKKGFVKTHRTVNIPPGLLVGSSPLINSKEKLAQYESAQHLPGGLEDTFVPMRNQLFLTIAANRAHSLGVSNLITGVCQTDSGGYPDCRQTFIHAMEDACRYAGFTPEEVHRVS